MKEYRKGSHTVYQLRYHFVFITKYRKPVLRGDVGIKLRNLIREICKAHDIVSRVMQSIKGKMSHHLMMEFRSIKKEFWGQHLWSRGYFVVTSGNVTDEVIAKYIEDQDVEPQDDDDFKVTE
jgi:putative transposase